MGSPDGEAWAGAAPPVHSQAPERGSDRPCPQSSARAPASWCSAPPASPGSELLERRALECCFQAPWHRSTWCLTHPFLNLILSPFHSFSHAVFTEVSHPHQTKHETSVPGARSLNQASRQSTEHRSPPYRLQYPATHSGVTDPNLHLGGDSCSQGHTVK